MTKRQAKALCDPYGIRVLPGWRQQLVKAQRRERVLQSANAEKSQQAKTTVESANV